MAAQTGYYYAEIKRTRLRSLTSEQTGTGGSSRAERRFLFVILEFINKRTALKYDRDERKPRRPLAEMIFRQFKRRY